MIKPKKFGGRPGRKPAPGERVHLGFRVSPDLKRKVERAAKDSTRSISQEAEARLEQSFLKEDALGGRELVRVHDLMAIAFAMGGQASEPDKSPKEWITIPSAYIAGMTGVLRALMAGLPNKEDAALAVQALLSESATQVVREREKPHATR
jgi:hypothetical protein